METSEEKLLSLLIDKERELKELQTYVLQLEQAYNSLAIKYNKLNEKYYSRDKKQRNQIGFKRNGG